MKFFGLGVSRGSYVKRFRLVDSCIYQTARAECDASLPRGHGPIQRVEYCRASQPFSFSSSSAIMTTVSKGSSPFPHNALATGCRSAVAAERPPTGRNHLAGTSTGRRRDAVVAGCGVRGARGVRQSIEMGLGGLGRMVPASSLRAGAGITAAIISRVLVGVLLRPPRPPRAAPRSPRTGRPAIYEPDDCADYAARTHQRGG